jgi:hypothetical protein
LLKGKIETRGTLSRPAASEDALPSIGHLISVWREIKAGKIAPFRGNAQGQLQIGARVIDASAQRNQVPFLGLLARPSST